MFFKLCEVLVSEESSYFSQRWIFQLKMYRLGEDINEKVTSYGYTIIIKFTQ